MMRFINWAKVRSTPNRGFDIEEISPQQRKPALKLDLGGTPSRQDVAHDQIYRSKQETVPFHGCRRRNRAGDAHKQECGTRCDNSSGGTKQAARRNNRNEVKNEEDAIGATA